MTHFILKIMQKWVEIDPKPDAKLAKTLYNTLAYSAEGSHWASRNSRWDGWTRLYNRVYHHFPLGLIYKVTELLVSEIDPVTKKPVHTFELQETRKEPQKLDFYVGLKWKDKLWEHQKLSIEKAVQYRYGTIAVATGGGKSVIAAGIIHEVQQRTVVFVPTKDLLYQFHATLEEQLGVAVGIVGDGQCDLRPITCCMLQTAARAMGHRPGKGLEKDSTKVKDKATLIKEYLRTVGAMIADECHIIPAATFYKVVQAVPNARWRIGLSATPFRTDKADMKIEAGAGPILIKVKSSDLIEKGILVPLEVRLYTLEDPNFEKRPFHKGMTYAEIFKEYVVDNKTRNALVIQESKRLYDAGRTVLIMVRHIDHGKALREIFRERLRLDVPFVYGGTTSQKRNEVKLDLANKRIRLCIATGIWQLGLDVKPLDAVVFAAPHKSAIMTLQKIGRVLRIAPEWQKKNAILIDIRDSNLKFLSDHAEAREEIYLSERAFTIKRFRVNLLPLGEEEKNPELAQTTLSTEFSPEAVLSHIRSRGQMDTADLHTLFPGKDELIDKLLSDLRTRGDLFIPRPGFVQVLE